MLKSKRNLLINIFQTEQMLEFATYFENKDKTIMHFDLS